MTSSQRTVPNDKRLFTRARRVFAFLALFSLFSLTATAYASEQEAAAVLQEKYAEFVRRADVLRGLTQTEIKKRIEAVDWKEADEPDFFHGMDFVSATTGWVVGWNGRIIHTQDGGANWTAQINSANEHLLAVDFVDEETGWAVGHEGIILHTLDGGKHWQNQASLGNRIPHFLGQEKALQTISCVDAKHCWTGGEDARFIFSTFDGGKHWLRQQTPANCAIRSIHFIDQYTGWAVSANGDIIGTHDGGKDWQRLASYPSKRFWSVHFVDPMHGWVVGNDASVLHSRDGGKTWTDQTPNIRLPEMVTPSDARLHVVRFVTRQRGWVAGLKGLFLATENGGANWSVQSYSGYNRLTMYAMHIHSPKLGWAAGNMGNVVATTNGGKDWFPVYGRMLDLLKAITQTIEKPR